jgi:hypothetical protein
MGEPSRRLSGPVRLTLSTGCDRRIAAGTEPRPVSGHLEPAAPPALARLAGTNFLVDLVRVLDIEFVPTRPQFSQQIDQACVPST